MPSRTARFGVIAFTAVACACCGTPVSSPTPSSAAPQARLSVTIDRFGSAFGISDVSPILFDARASTGDGLTYRLDFGDGLTSTNPVEIHPVTAIPTGYGPVRYTATATVTDRQGRTASASQSFDVFSLVNGAVSVWVGRTIAGNLIGNIQHQLRFSFHEGRTVAGRYEASELFDDRITTPEKATFTGAIMGDRSIVLTLSTGTTLEGTVYSVKDAYVPYMALRVHGGPLDGTEMNLVLYSSY